MEEDGKGGGVKEEEEEEEREKQNKGMRGREEGIRVQGRRGLVWGSPRYVLARCPCNMQNF